MEPGSRAAGRAASCHGILLSQAGFPALRSSRARAPLPPGGVHTPSLADRLHEPQLSRKADWELGWAQALDVPWSLAGPSP